MVDSVPRRCFCRGVVLMSDIERPDLEAILETARSAAVTAGALQRARFGDPGRIDHKRELELVTEVDVACEEAIVALIRARYPHHDVLAEESGASGAGSPHRWIIDPLDGTTNFARGLPIFASSVAYAFEGRVLAAACDLPMWEQTFWGLRGHGAWCNDRRLGVSGERALGGSFWATGFPYDVRDNPDNGLDHFDALILQTMAIRRPGAAVVDLCCVADGRFDGFWELRLQPWDTAAGALLVEEAGGRVTTREGAAWDPWKGSIVASNGHLHEQMLEALAASRADPTSTPGSEPNGAAG